MAVTKVYFFILAINLIYLGNCHNKYSAEAHSETIDFRPNSLKDLDKPFRMAKLNMLWTKAKIRLSETKLKSIFGELKIHDKEEITLKRIKAEGLDKEGLKEAELRKKLLDIMHRFDLLEHFEDIQDPSKYKHHKAMNEASEEHINKSLFKDKKLNKLWAKAETAGFTTEELEALKEEFTHHQNKVDQYFSLLKDAKDNTLKDNYENSIDQKLDRFNTIDVQEEEPKSNYIDTVNSLRGLHKEINDNFDRLNYLAARGPDSKEFVEPKVQGLWKIALESNFPADELESLRIELRHYENRLLKLRHLQVEAALNEDTHKKKQMKLNGVKPPGMQQLEDDIKKQSRKVEKIHLDLESRILQKHVEL